MMFMKQMRKSNNLMIFVMLASVAIIIGVGYLAMRLMYDPAFPAIEIPLNGSIAVKGQMVCLPHRDTRGPQTLECAFGLLDAQGRYYALRDTDPTYKNISAVGMNIPVEVRGIFTARKDSKYQDIGIIEVTSIAAEQQPALGDRTTLTGTYACLPHKVTTGPQTDECASGLKLANGSYYALDFQLMSQPIPEHQNGDTMTASGLLTPIEAISTDQWQKYDIKGFFSVTDIVTTTSTSKDNLIRLASPQPNSLVRSPLIIHGQARGTWYFEASFPVRLLDAKGTVIIAQPAQAQSDWMTEDFVPFTSTLTFKTPSTTTGWLVLAKDNPSGLPEHDDELRIPVRFK